MDQIIALSLEVPEDLKSVRDQFCGWVFPLQDKEVHGLKSYWPESFLKTPGGQRMGMAELIFGYVM